MDGWARSTLWSIKCHVPFQWPPAKSVVYNWGRVCLSIFERPWHLHIRYISREYGSSSYMKAIGSRSRSHEKKARKSLFTQCKTSIDNNSGSIKHKVFGYRGSSGVTAIFVTWPKVTMHSTKCTHSRVVGLGLEGNLDSNNYDKNWSG